MLFYEDMENITPDAKIWLIGTVERKTIELYYLNEASGRMSYICQYKNKKELTKMQIEIIQSVFQDKIYYCCDGMDIQLEYCQQIIKTFK
jgi:hypothetical protein